MFLYSSTSQTSRVYTYICPVVQSLSGVVIMHEGCSEIEKPLTLQLESVVFVLSFKGQYN